MLGNFACYLSSADIFKTFQEYDQSVKQFGSISGLMFCRKEGSGYNLLFVHGTPEPSLHA